VEYSGATWGYNWGQWGTSGEPAGCGEGVAMFLGTHAPRLDDKGRLVLPAKFREQLATGLVLTKGQDRSIVVWPAAEFAAYAERLNEASRSDARVRAYLRVLFSGASDEIPDRQGRITVPPALREYAGLDRDVIVVGNGSTAEIWDEPTWQTYLGSQDRDFSEIDEEVIPGVM
jgi:MraZ protein